MLTSPLSGCTTGRIMTTAVLPAGRDDVIRAVFTAGAMPPVLAPRHLALAAHLRVDWMPVESGAPCIDAERPLVGEGPAVALAKAALDTEDAALAIRTLAEVGRLIPDIVAGLALAPGVYAVPADMRAWFATGACGVDDAGFFDLRAEHLVLLRAAQWRVVDSDCIDDVLAYGDEAWPMPYIDGKRPYGDCSYYQLDIARLLGEPYALDDRGYAIPAQDKDDRLEQLHVETLGALQVLLAHGSMKD